MAGSKDISEEERKNNIDKAEEQFNLALEFTPKEERMDICSKSAPNTSMNISLNMPTGILSK